MSDLELNKTYGLFDNPLNKKLIDDLRRNGEDVLIFQPMHSQSVELTETSAGVLQNLEVYDWLIFTDVFAADHFIEKLNERGVDFFELDNLTTCALGEAVADRLRFVQVHADVIPSKLVDEAIFSAISNFAGAELENLKILVVSELSDELVFTEKLKAGGAVIENLPVYQAEFTDDALNTKLRTLLKGGAVDEFIFSTPEDLLGLRFLTSGTDLREILKESRISAVSEIVFQTLQEYGFRPLYFRYR